MLRKFITTRLALQELLKEALNKEGTTSTSHCKNVPNEKAIDTMKKLQQLMGKITS